jgi:hypothetical protein
MKTCENCGNEHDGTYGSGRFCSTKCSRGFSTKAKRAEINEKVSKTIKNKLEKGEYVGFAKPNKSYEEQTCFNCKSIFYSKKNRKYCSNSCKNNCTSYKELMKKIGASGGGPRNGAGRGKSGMYKNIWCDSSYELAWVIYNLEHNIKFERNKKGYSYEFNGKKHKYYPDFIVNEKLIEIKGFLRENDKHKFKSVEDKELIILFKKDLEVQLEYTINKYGKDYIRLYEH